MRTDNSSCDTLDRIQPGFADTDPRTPERRSTRSSNSSTRSEQHRSFVPGEQMPPTLGNEMAEFLADIVHSLVSSKLKRMADQTSLRRDGSFAIVELGSSGKPLARLLAVLNETVRRVKPLELDLIDRAAKRGQPRAVARWKPPTSATATNERSNSNSFTAIDPLQRSSTRQTAKPKALARPVALNCYLIGG
jgi:hypothetical protein